MTEAAVRDVPRVPQRSPGGRAAVNGRAATQSVGRVMAAGCNCLKKKKKADSAQKQVARRKRRGGGVLFPTKHMFACNWRDSACARGRAEVA